MANPDNIDRARWSTAVHEVGHALVLEHLGVKVRKILVGIGGDDWSGRTCRGSSGPDLSLIGQLTICVAGSEAQELLECDLAPSDHGGAADDYGKLQTLLDDHDIAEYERDDLYAAAHRKAREILSSQLDRLKELARKAAAGGAVTLGL
jgi:hypothetical protein